MATKARPADGKPAATKRPRKKPALDQLPAPARDRMAAYERCSALWRRAAGEKEAAAVDLADDLETMLTAVRQFCGRQMLAVDAAAVVIQPAGGLPPVIIPLDQAGNGDPLPACVVPPAYHFRGRAPRGH